MILQIFKEKQIEGISEVRDESDRDGIRLVIELKRDAMSDIVLNNLFKSTQMEVTFGVIMLAINNKEPKIFSLIELLRLFLKQAQSPILEIIVRQRLIIGSDCCGVVQKYIILYLIEQAIKPILQFLLHK